MSRVQEMVAIPLSSYTMLQKASSSQSATPPASLPADEVLKTQIAAKEFGESSTTPHKSRESSIIPKHTRVLTEESVPLESERQLQVLLHTLIRSGRFSVNGNGEIVVDGTVYPGTYLWDVANAYYTRINAPDLNGYPEFLKLVREIGLPSVPELPRDYITETNESDASLLIPAKPVRTKKVPPQKKTEGKAKPAKPKAKSKAKPEAKPQTTPDRAGKKRRLQSPSDVELRLSRLLRRKMP